MIREVTTYINKHIENNISLDDVSKFSGYSPFYLQRKIKTEVGLSMKQYVIKKRFEAATWYLTFTNMSIKEIIITLGYSDGSSFTRTFKRKTKYSPTDYRKMQQQKNHSRVFDALNTVPYEIKIIPNKKTVVFPKQGNYFSENTYEIWNEVHNYLLSENLNPEDFEFYGQYQDYAFLDTTSPYFRYEAILVSKLDMDLKNKKFFKNEIPGGKYICFKISSPASECKQLIKNICKQLFFMENIELRAGAPIFKYDQLASECASGYISGELQIPCNTKRS